jgi:hypothetical protein
MSTGTLDRANPPPIGRPFRGITTNHSTTSGRTAPNASPPDHHPSRAVSLGSRSAQTTPHSPPQNAAEMLCGTPKGGTGAMFQGANGTGAPAA